VLQIPLTVWKQQSYLFLIGFVNNRTLTQGSFPFPGFGGQNMASMRFVIDKFSAGSGLESFGRRPVCFDFGHCFVSLKYNSLMKIYHSFVKNQNKHETAIVNVKFRTLHGCL
jgi:hypothetical protein